MPKASGRIELPLHIRWSGPPLTYDLDDRADRARVYEQVLREGTEGDVRFYVDAEQLLELWDELVLPPAVREAWAARIARLRDDVGAQSASGAGRRDRRRPRRGGRIRARRRRRADRPRATFNGRPATSTSSGSAADAVDRLAPAVDRALSDAGLAVGHVQENPGFVRLIVSDGDDRTELDLAADARLFPAEPGRLAPTLTGEELAVDKVLAVFGRAEARDFVDLMAIEPRYGLDRLCELAAEKDCGFDARRCSPRCSAASTGCGGTSSSSTTPSTSNSAARSQRWRERALELRVERA